MTNPEPVMGVVLAAGRGTRMGSLTSDRSKAMVPVAGYPMIGRVMEMLAAGGCDRMIVVVHRGDEALVRFLKSGRWAASTQIAFQERRLGMAQAVECAGPLVLADGRPEFVLASCDNIYPDGYVSDLLECRRQDGLDAALTLMKVTRNAVPTLAVVVMREGLASAIVEKPHPDEAPSSLGVPSLYVLSTRILEYLPLVPVTSRGEREFPDALRLLIEDGGRVGGLTVSSRLTLTRPQDLLSLTRYFLRRDPERAVVARGLPAGARVVPPVRVESRAHLGPGCTIGPEAVLEDGCQVGRNAVVRGSVVTRGARVASGALIENAVLT